MNDQNILQQFKSVNTWESSGIRAPHVLMLMWLALGEIQRGNIGYIPYSTIEPKLKELLTHFGPPRKIIYTSFPFIRLANNEPWQFNKPEIINTNEDYSNKHLLGHNLQENFRTQNMDKINNIIIFFLYFNLYNSKLSI